MTLAPPFVLLVAQKAINAHPALPRPLTLGSYHRFACDSLEFYALGLRQGHGLTLLHICRWLQRDKLHPPKPAGCAANPMILSALWKSAGKRDPDRHRKRNHLAPTVSRSQAVSRVVFLSSSYSSSPIRQTGSSRRSYRRYGSGASGDPAGPPSFARPERWVRNLSS